MNDFPQELLEITEFLASQKELLIKGSGDDARRDSAEIERKIIDLLENQNRWKIQDPDFLKNNNRSWYDFSFLDKNNKKNFVNLKISTCKSVDNTNCTGGIYYVLTGEMPPSNMTDIIPKIKNNLKENSNDYYFLIIKKPIQSNSNLPNAFSCSLKTLKIIKPAGNNIPFQCNWGHNVEHQSRSYEEAYRFILKGFGKSLKQRAERYNDFIECFPDIDLEDEGNEGRDA